MKTPKCLDGLIETGLDKVYGFLDNLDIYIEKHPIRSILYFGTTVITTNSAAHFFKDIVYRGPKKEDLINAVILAGCGYAIKKIFSDVNSEGTSKKLSDRLPDMVSEDMALTVGFITLSKELGKKYLGKVRIYPSGNEMINALDYFEESIIHAAQNGLLQPEKTLKMLPILETAYLFLREMFEDKTSQHPRVMFGDIENLLEEVIGKMEQFYGYKRSVTLKFSDKPITEVEIQKMLEDIRKL